MTRQAHDVATSEDPDPVEREAAAQLHAHGRDADLIVATRADACLLAGDISAYMFWKKVVRAIDHPLST